MTEFAIKFSQNQIKPNQYKTIVNCFRNTLKAALIEKIKMKQSWLPQKVQF